MFQRASGKKTVPKRERPRRICKNQNAKIKCDLAIGHHLLTNPEPV